MRRHLSLAIAAVFFCHVAVAQTVDYNALGKQVAQDDLQTLHDNVNSTNAQNDTTDYTTDQPLSSDFGGPSLFNLGATKITDCAASTDGTDLEANQECDAVNFLAKNPLQSYAITASDPVVAAATATMAGASGTVLANGCVESTTTTPASYTTETCDEYYVSDTNSCTEGEVVDVTAESQFSCDVTNEYQYTDSCDDDVTCLPPGAQCVQNFETQCAPSLGANGQCCTITVDCTSTTTATISYHDCCLNTYTSSVTMSQFESSTVQLIPSVQGGATITCDSTGACDFDINNYECDDPAISNGNYNYPDAFNIPGTPATCSDTGGCSLLDSEIQ